MDLKDKLSQEIDKAESEIKDIVDNVNDIKENLGNKNNEQKCSKCGAVVKVDEKFCSECGTLIKLEDKSLLDRIHVLNNKKAITIIGVLLICIVGIVLLFNSMAFNVNCIKAEDMIKDYIRNEMIAEDKYKEKTITVTGSVVSKYQFSNSVSYGVVICDKYDDNTRKYYSIVVDFPCDKVNLVNKIANKNFIVVKGKCVGIVPQENVKSISVQIEGDKVLF